MRKIIASLNLELKPLRRLGQEAQPNLMPSEKMLNIE
jgi:hypothetical protein